MTTTGTGFQNLPPEICLEVFSLLGVPEVRRLYINCPSEEIKGEVAKYLRTQVVKVTAEPIIDGDMHEIDFATYARLPRCHIHVTTSVGGLSFTKWHLNQVGFESLTLNVFSDYRDFAPCDLSGLHGNVTSVDIYGRIIVDIAEIPVSVTMLSFRYCSLPASPSFARFTKLTYFRCCNCKISQFDLPPSITDLIVNNDDDNNMSVCDASSLTKLKHVSGNGVVNFSPALVETVRLPRLPDNPQFDQLQKIVLTGDTPSFKSVPCPKLEQVEYGGDHGGGDVTELFTHDQMGQLTLLGGRHLVIVNMDPFYRLNVLSMKVDVPMTKHFPLPPQLSWLTIYSSVEVEGIPSQVRHFEYVGLLAFDDQAPCAVTVASSTLETLIVTTAEIVTVDCPALITLTIIEAEILRTSKGARCFAPILVRTSLPMVLNPFGLINSLTLSGLNQSVVVDRHLKSITLRNMELNKVVVSADVVEIDDCDFAYNMDPPAITATVLILSCFLQTVDNVVCQELRCRRACLVSRIPTMVEKLTFSILGTNDSALISLAACHQLRAVTISSAKFRNIRPHGFTIPASVRHFVLYRAEWGEEGASLRFADGSQLQHFECWCEATPTQLGVSPDSVPSFFHFQPQLLPP